MSWSDERVELLKKLWAEGLTCSQIAGRIGGITRNAVIGKVQRLGLSGRVTPSRMKKHRPRPRPMKTENGVRKPHAPRVNPEIASGALRALYVPYVEPSASQFTPGEELVIPVAERKTVETLVECSCRWPIGDPQQKEFHFCGKKKVAGLPYCEFHARRAFQPAHVRDRAQKKVLAIAK